MVKRQKHAKRRRRTLLLDLPEDLIMLILYELKQEDIQSLSLVSKAFRSITNMYVHKLTFHYLPSNSAVYQKLFARFSYVDEITINTKGMIIPALKAISNSELEIERLVICGKQSYYPKRKQVVDMIRFGRLKMVKYLEFGWFWNAAQRQVVEFIHPFPSLQVLTLSDCSFWTDKGIKLLVSKVQNLNELNLTANNTLTDRTLDTLSNCVTLESISLQDCHSMTVQGVCAFLCRKMHTLKKLCVHSWLQGADIFPLAENISSCENLNYLSVFGPRTTDASLCVIAKSRSPLTTLHILPFETDEISDIIYTMKGLSVILRAFQGLTTINIGLPSSASVDKEMSQLVKSLPHLSTVSLHSKYAIYATLFSLMQNCPSLRFIYMLSFKSTRLPTEVPQLTKNYNILGMNIDPMPNARLMGALQSLCPNALLY